jgi:hypothetical protein
VPILKNLDGAELTPEAFGLACVTLGWDRPIDDGIGLWESKHASEDTCLILDTLTRPTTLLCRLDGHDDYEPEALVEGVLRRRFDANFVACAEVLKAQRIGKRKRVSRGAPKAARIR